MMRMLLTGERFTAQHAYECGLVSHIADGDLDEYTANLAAEMAKAASTTLILGKRGFYQQKEMTIEEAYEFAGRVMAGNFAMADSQEGVSSFLEKRLPQWK
jgi:enoyl-CoA hydratase/carnithine racemase